MLDVYFSDKYKHHWPKICDLAKRDDADARKALRAYALEAGRLATQAVGLFRNVTQDYVLEEGGKTYKVKTGDKVFVNLVNNPRLTKDVAYPRSVQTLIQLPSPIHWKSNLIVRRGHMSSTDGDRTNVWEGESILLRKPLFYAPLLACRACVVLLDLKVN